jgi:hypothetical protein
MPPTSDPRKVMIAALEATITHLPLSAQAGVRLAAQTADLSANEAARVALWQSIQGRDSSCDPEVLCTRLAICVLHPDGIAMDPQSSLEYFVYTFRAAGLPESALTQAAALELQLSGA